MTGHTYFCSQYYKNKQHVSFVYVGHKQGNIMLKSEEVSLFCRSFRQTQRHAVYTYQYKALPVPLDKFKEISTAAHSLDSSSVVFAVTQRAMISLCRRLVLNIYISQYKITDKTKQHCRFFQLSFSGQPYFLVTGMDKWNNNKQCLL